VRHPDIPYDSVAGVEPSLLSLDIYQIGFSPLSNEPKALTNAPVLIYVHGGGGIRGDKAISSDLGIKPAYFLRREGFLFVSVNYRLNEAGRYPVAPQDVANAVAWVNDHIAEYGGDPNRLVLMGHSFGGLVAARVATIDRFLQNAGKNRSIIKGVITVDAGGLDGLTGADTDQGRKRLIGQYGPNRSDWEAASPVHSVGKGKPTPAFLLMHVGNAQTRTGHLGGTENDAVAMAEALRAGGHSGQLVELLGKDHNQAGSDIGLVDDPATRAVQRFLSSIRPQGNER
jgi:acetyl esterase/lipase